MSWEEAKTKFNELKFPDDEWFVERSKHHYDPNKSESHSEGKETHSLKTYYFPLTRVGEHLVEASYNHCDVCCSTRTAFLVMFNDQESCCVKKYFVRKGEVVRGMIV